MKSRMVATSIKERYISMAHRSVTIPISQGKVCTPGHDRPL